MNDDFSNCKGIFEPDFGSCDTSLPRTKDGPLTVTKVEVTDTDGNTEVRHY